MVEPTGCYKKQLPDTIIPFRAQDPALPELSRDTKNGQVPHSHLLLARVPGRMVWAELSAPVSV